MKCLPIIVPTVYYSFQCLKYMSKTSKKLTRSQFLELLDMNEFCKGFFEIFVDLIKYPFQQKFEIFFEEVISKD